LENLDLELISSKENIAEITLDQDAVLEIHPKDPEPQHQVIHQAQEEDSQEESGEETDVEIPKNIPTTKPGRRTNKARREKVTTQDKDLGTQPTLEEILRKEGKNGKLQPVGAVSTHEGRGIKAQ
jgi:hypothetical protein